MTVVKLSLAKVTSLHVSGPTGAKRAATRPKLVAHDLTGNVVNIGDTVTSFRGETATLYSLNRPKGDGRSGKVSVIWDGRLSGSIPGNNEYYDGVFNITVSVAHCESCTAPKLDD